ncbi:MAG: DUF1080 domain-containing protein [Verrucomicrobia bacterium]|nr:DUF1080 domain-containing protein [Verrucomicrobiota bacterium]
MKTIPAVVTRYFIQACAVVVLLLSPPTARSADGFVDLFNGRDLTGWVNVNTAPSTWTVSNGMIVCSGQPIGELRTERMYQNFVLELEWRHLRPGGNSGIFVWADDITARGQPFHRGVEVQVLDGRNGDGYTSHGDIFPIHGATMTPENSGKFSGRAYPTERRSKSSPEWNHYRIECQDGAIALAVNGKVVTRGRDASPRKGYICLESEGGLVHFRNLRLKELPDTPLAAGQVAQADRGFKCLYNGIDFTGWDYTPEHAGHWITNDWILDYDGKSKDLWTAQEFGDFELIVDWRWTAKPQKAKLPVIRPDGSEEKDADGKTKTAEALDAGDSGIYLRGSSKSQVNIWCWPVGSGEVWGYRTDASQPPEVRAGATPKLKADAPIGQWNRFHITMVGERLTVVLNDKTVIENARLPGVSLRGKIALQNHGHPIQFANLYVRAIKP